MNLPAAIAEVIKLISKVPPDVRQIALEVLRGIAVGDEANVVADRARRAAIASAAKRAYRRGGS